MITYQTALGISTGDLVTTSYNTGPYIITAISAPQTVINDIRCKVILPWPVVHLTLTDAKASSATPYYINEVHQEGNRYFSGPDEIFITRSPASAMQISLFNSPEPEPPPLYAFQPGVNYQCLDQELWQCERCLKDFNALTTPTYAQMIAGDPRGHHPPCPACGYFSKPLFVIQPGQRIKTYWVQNSGRLVQQYRQTLAPKGGMTR